MGNSLANRVKFALEQGNVVDLVARGFTTASDTITVNSCKMVGNTIVADIVSGHATTAILGITAPFGFKVIGGHVLATAAKENGIVTVKNVTTAITDAVDCAVDKVVTPVGTIDDAQYYVAEDVVMNIVIAVDGSAGIVVLDIIPT